ncbi:IgA peptidase M64-domain-containing protein [Pholiota molesta]|nr:IgA peptidase M64-domain-containing protein [Pholiota molesta]
MELLRKRPSSKPSRSMRQATSHQLQCANGPIVRKPSHGLSSSFGNSTPSHLGPSSNRVDFVFFSDGYTPEEYKKFVSDALRLAEDVTKNQTFNTVQPLLNFWAAFSPSKESGIGVGGVPKDTPFGLYRDGTELRGVYYEHPEVGKAACDAMGDQCDYPILLGNDPLYGGLGGQFTVITASILNGPLVLRHELGHSILDVGEEYDGGFAYFGRNAAHAQALPWKQWLSDPSRVDATGGPYVERSVMAMQAYPWTLLNISTPWAINFTSSGAYSRYSLQFSLSGLPHKQDLRVTLDDVDLRWVPRPDIGMDRWFYNFHFTEPLTPGQHQLKFTLLNGDKQGSAQLCSTEVLEFGTEEEFVSEPGFYSLYPTYSEKNETSYRPTNEDCLMRAVATPNFCKVCLETLWLHLLKGVSLVDSIEESCEKSQAVTFKVLSLNLLPLAHLRKVPAIPKEAYSIIWKKDGDLLSDFTNKTRIQIDAGNSVGEYIVHVKFFTEEIRLETSRTETYASHIVRDVCK